MATQSVSGYLIMRWLLALCFIISIICASAQRTMLSGRVIDQQDEPIIGAHVRNKTIGKITVSSASGSFQLPAIPGDSLYLTMIGFTPSIHILTLRDFASDFTIKMKESTLSLNEVTVYSIPPIDTFKKMIMETQVKDSAVFWYFGVSKPVAKVDKMAAGMVHKKFLYAVLQPTNFLYYNLSKQEKEKRKYYQLQQSQSKTLNAVNKFTRAWVTEQIGLEGDELTNFIAFCNFSIDYLDKFPIYVIREDMMVKLEEFKKIYGK